MNAFAYLQEGGLPAGEEVAAMLDGVAKHPGQLLGCAIELPPGDNEVLAYVELVLEDDASLEEALDELARRFEAARGANDAPFAFVAEVAALGALRCGVTGEVEWQDALAQLSGGIRAALAATLPEPLIIIREQMSDLALYRLEPTTRDRLEKVHHAGWHFAPLRVRDEDASTLEVTRRSLLPHIAEVVTGLPRRSIEGLGGLRMITPEGETLLDWAAADWAAVRPHSHR